MSSKINTTNFTPYINKGKSTAVHQERNKYVMFIFAAGVLIIAFAVGLLMYRIYTRRKKRARRSHDRHFRMRPLPLPPIRTEILPGIIHGTGETSSGYITPVARGLRLDASHTQPMLGGIPQGSDGYLIPVVRGPHYNNPSSVRGSRHGSSSSERDNVTPPLLPPKDYENNQIERQLSNMAPVHINGNIEQLNICPGTAFTLGAVQFRRDSEKS